MAVARLILKLCADCRINLILNVRVSECDILKIDRWYNSVAKDDSGLSVELIFGFSPPRERCGGDRFRF